MAKLTQWSTSPAAVAYCVMAALIAPSLPAHAQDLRGITRAQVTNDLENSNIGAGYAQMLNFFSDPSISASYLEADDGTEYDVFKLPLQYEVPINDRGWQLALRGTLSHATAENTFSIIEGERIEGSWEASSGQLGAGLIVPFTEELSWFVAGQLGVSRLKNEADYRGPISKDILAPLVDGILFNWDTNATIAGVSGGLDYRQRFADTYNLDLTARYTYSQIDSYSESRDLASFSEDTGTVSITADLDHPWNMALGNLPLFGTVHAGGTAFTGPNRDTLGFSHFYLLGYSIGIKVGETNRYFDSFSVGAHANFGSDVEGYSLRFAWQLK